MEIGTCRICHKKFYDTTTCPACLHRYLEDLNAKNLPPGIEGSIDYKEWAELQIISNLLGDGEISEAEAKRRMAKQIKIANQRNAAKVANERRVNEEAQKRREQQQRLYSL